MTSDKMREEIARTLYECEKRRADHSDRMICEAKGRPFQSTMEPWEECKDVFLSDADALLPLLSSVKKDDVPSVADAPRGSGVQPQQHAAIAFKEAFDETLRTFPIGRRVGLTHLATWLNIRTRQILSAQHSDVPPQSDDTFPMSEAKEGTQNPTQANGETAPALPTQEQGE